ncbi:glycosyltransferase family 4 protein [bacterium]|nr:glycosyltransferase family 4 protein [bacterium]
MRVALVHDHLLQQGGAERVLEAFAAIWPHAPLYTLAMDRVQFSHFGHREIYTSFLDRLPLGRTFFRWLLPLMPTAIESFDLQNADVVVSSVSALAKGVITHPHTIHICYCHTPTRYLWSETQEYIEELDTPRFVKRTLPPMLSWLRTWDRIAAERVDVFIANSETVRKRIKKYYGKESIVIHPPVDIERFRVSDTSARKYFLAGGRLVAYKRFDIIVDAFTKLGKPLVIFGTGPAEEDLRRRAGKNITFVGHVSDEERSRLFSEAIAFIHPQEEDFGITAVESMASGRPVIAYAKGGASETVIEGLTGTLFYEQSAEELMDTILHFSSDAFSPTKIRAFAEQFSPHAFRERILALVREHYTRHKQDTLGDR